MLCVSDVSERAALGFVILTQAPVPVVYGVSLGVRDSRAWAEVIALVVTSGYF